MNFDLINVQENIKNILINTRDKNRLSHAYIFSGPQGVGKKEMALYFAMMLYCNEKTPCMTCDNCKQIMAQEHLNVVIVEPETKVIKKEQIVQLHEEFSKTSQIEGPRIYIIIDADKMNQNSQNSLLKFIEEPTDGIYGILCTTNPSQLLPTITSRCQTINFNALDSKLLKKSIIENGISKDMASLISLLTNDLGQAIELAHNDDILKLKTLFEKFLSLKNESDAVLFQIANSSFFENATNLKMFMDLLIVLYEDILATFSGSLNINLEEYSTLIGKYRNRLTRESAIEHLELIYELSKKLLYNVSSKNIITNLLVNLF